jgi:putative phosphoesterase
MIDYHLALDFSEHKSLVIGILSDTHGSINADIAAFISQCDIALHAGDVMGSGPLKALQPRLGHTLAVKGNNDAHSSWEPHDHAMLDEIPDILELNLPGGKLVMEHSHRFWDHDVNNIHDSLRREHADAQLIVYGHTHIRTIDESQIPAIVNPGAAGKVRVHDGPSCLQLTVSSEKWEIQSHLFENT